MVQVVVFDVNETLSDMAPLADRFADVGAPPALARLWFAALLRDGFARTAAGESERFALPLSPALSPEGEREIAFALASSLLSHAVTRAPLASSASTVASPDRASPYTA